MGIRLLIRSLFWFNGGNITAVLLFLLVMSVSRSSPSIFTSSPLTEEIETRPFGEDTFHLFLNNVTREKILTGQHYPDACEDVKDKSPIVINIWSYSPDGKLQLDQRKEISKRILPLGLGGSVSSSENEIDHDLAVPVTSLSNRILPVKPVKPATVTSTSGESNHSIVLPQPPSSPLLPTIPPTTSSTNEVILFLLGTLVSLQKKLQEQQQNKLTGLPGPIRGGASSVGSGERFSTAPSMSPRQLSELGLSTESTNDENVTMTPITPEEFMFDTLYLDILRLTKADRVKAQVKIGRADDYNYSFDDEDFSRNLGEEALRIGNLTIEPRPLNARLMHNLFNLTSGSASSSLTMKKHCVPTLPEDGGDTQIPSPTNIPFPTSLGQSGLSSVFPKDEDVGLFLQDWWGFGPPSNKQTKKKKEKDKGWGDGWGWEEDKKKDKKKKDKKKEHKKKEEHHEHHEPQGWGWGWGWQQVHQPSYGAGWGWQPQHKEEHHGWEEEHKEEEHEKKKKKKKKKDKKHKKEKKKKKKKKKKKHEEEEHGHHEPEHHPPPPPHHPPPPQHHHPPPPPPPQHHPHGVEHHSEEKHGWGWGHQEQPSHGWGHQEQSSHGWGHQPQQQSNHGWGKPSKGWGPPSLEISGWLGGMDGWGWGSGHDGYYEMEFIPADIFSKLLTGFGFMALFLGPVVFVAGICWLISSIKSPAYIVHGRSGGGWGWHRRIGLESHDEPPKFNPKRSRSRFSRFG